MLAGFSGTVICDGVARYYGKSFLPNIIHEAGIDELKWIMLHHTSIDVALERSQARLLRSGKKRTGKSSSYYCKIRE